MKYAALTQVNKLHCATELSIPNNFVPHSLYFLSSRSRYKQMRMTWLWVEINMHRRIHIEIIFDVTVNQTQCLSCQILIQWCVFNCWAKSTIIVNHTPTHPNCFARKAHLFYVQLYPENDVIHLHEVTGHLAIVILFWPQQFAVFSNCWIADESFVSQPGKGEHHVNFDIAPTYIYRNNLK